MEKAKIISRNEIDIIDYDQKLCSLEFYKHQVIKSLRDDDEQLQEAESYYASELAKLDVYKDFHLTIPELENELDAVIPYYEEEDGIINQKWEIVQNDINQVNRKIDTLRAELTAKDYINMKRFQGQIPDDKWTEFTLWAEGKRVEIRELEKLLNEDKPNATLV